MTEPTTKQIEQSFRTWYRSRWSWVMAAFLAGWAAGDALVVPFLALREASAWLVELF